MNKILDSLEPSFRPKIDLLIQTCQEHGLVIAPTSTGGRRTITQQNKLFAIGRDKDDKIIGKIVTKARGGQSPHNFGLACDLVPIINGKENWNPGDDVWNFMHRVAEQIGLVTGYEFKTIKDSPHFEDPKWKEAQALWKQGKLEVV